MKWATRGPMPQFGASNSWSAQGALHSYAITQTREGFYASYRLPILKTRATFLNEFTPYDSLDAAKAACEEHAKRIAN